MLMRGRIAFSAERARALRLAGAFLLLGALWIVVSDLLVEARSTDPQLLPTAQTWKGLLFVAAAALFVYVVVERELRMRRRAEGLAAFRARLLEEVGQAVIATDVAGRITYWNPAAERLFGWSAAEVLGRDVMTVTPAPVSRDLAKVAMGTLTADGHWRGELLLSRRDGSSFPALVADTALRDDAGRTVGMVGITTDLSALHEVRSELRRRQTRFRALIEHVSEITTRLDAAGRIEYASPAAARLLGWEAREFAGRNLFGAELIHGDDIESTRAALESILAEPDAVRTIEARVLCRDGRYLLMEHRVQNLLAEEAVGSIVVHSRDVSEKRRLEEQLRQSQKMEAVGRLAGGVAHDFNNILTAIAGNAELLLMDMADDDPRRPEVEEVQKAARRASDLTRQLLAFSRKQVQRIDVLDIDAVANDARPMLARLIGERFELVVALAAGHGVRADRAQIEQILMNLVVNARDAMPDGGRIEIATESITIAADHAADEGVPVGDYVCLRVSDTGCGIDPAITEQIFEPFFTTKPPGKGTGLGLSMVYGLVQQSGGHIRVRSQPGVATHFRIFFPRVALEAAAGEAASEAPQHGGETLLVVEDDPAVLDLTVRMLSKHGYAVQHVPGPAEALDLLAARNDLQLVISDVVMPGMTGYELAEKLATTHPRVRVLLMSGYAADAMPSSNGSAASTCALLEKPFSVDQLLIAVRAALDAPAGEIDTLPGSRKGDGVTAP